MSLFEVHFHGPGDGPRGGAAGPRAGGGAPWFSSSPFAAAARFGLPLARRGAGVGAFVLAIVTAGALAHVGVRLKGLEVAYDLGRERRVATEMEELRRRLQIEIGMLKDPRRVIAIAREKLNMGPPPPEAIWRLGSGSSAAAWATRLPLAGAAPAAAAANNNNQVKWAHENKVDRKVDRRADRRAEGKNHDQTRAPRAEPAP